MKTAIVALLTGTLLSTPVAAAAWSEKDLKAVVDYADSIDTAALMVVHKGQVVLDWGATDTRYNAQSMRKSLLSALIGIAVGRGQIDIQRTLAELKIDDVDGLTAAEKQAKVVDLLMSRSGVYHSALYETTGNRRRKPARGSHGPGEFFYYNNWDFNALGTIYEKATRTSIGEAFEREIARPLQMQDFRPGDVVYLTQDSLTERLAGNRSIHPAYVFMISARDLARLGVLYLHNGQWKGKQIVPAEWVRASIEGKPAGKNAHYGYMWWVYPDARLLRSAGLSGKTFMAEGNRGHFMVVIPSLDLVIVHRVATRGVGLLPQMKRRFFGSPAVSDEEGVKLLQLIIAAHPAARPRG
jgi:CubicO group peptidase (beta-lactamase class C family)